MASLITIVVAVSVMEATTEPMEVDMEDRGPIGLMDPTYGPYGPIGPSGPIGMYEPKSPTLPILSYDSYHPLSCI
jgi:hypothetical protein